MRSWVLAALLVCCFATLALAKIGGGDIVYKIKHIGDVTFRHDTHVETMGFTCTECHPLTFGTKEQHKSFQMSHRRQSQSCGTCHNAQNAFDLKSNCYVCHIKEVN